MVDEIEPNSSPGVDHGLRGFWARIPAGPRLVIPIALLLAVVVVSFYNWVRPSPADWSRLPSRLVCQLQSGATPPPSLTVASIEVAHPRGNVLQLVVHFAQALPPSPGDQLTYSLANNGAALAVLTEQQGSSNLAIRNVLQPGGADVRSDKGTHAARTLPDAVEMVLDLTKFGIQKELVSPSLTVSSQGYAMQICDG